MEETKVIYYGDDDKVPFLIKLNVAPDKACLRDFKQSLTSTNGGGVSSSSSSNNGRNYKYFFQTIVDDFGMVKEELCDDEAKLPHVNGRVVAWVVPIEPSLSGSIDNKSQSSININNNNNNNNNNNEQNAGGKHDNNNYENDTINNHFSSMQSISSNGSSCNNENYIGVKVNNAKSNSNHMNNNNNYESLNSRKNSINSKHSNNPAAHHHRQLITPLKDLNCDDTSTDTDSLINAFVDFKLKQKNKQPNGQQLQQQQQQLANGKRTQSKPHFSSFNNHMNQPNRMNDGHGHSNKGKLSLDSRAMMGHHQQHQQFGNHHRNVNGNHQQHFNHQHLHHPYHTSVGSNRNSFKAGKKKSKSGDELSLNGHDDLLGDELSTKIETTAGAPSILSSDLDTTTFFDTENDPDDDYDYDDDEEDDDDDDDQFSSITNGADTTSTSTVSKRYHLGRNARRNNRPKPLRVGMRHNSLHSSVTSLTDSTLSLNIITVTLNMDSVNFLGISIVGQSNKTGEGGIYVGSIMNGGAVALDGRIEPGDMILQVNEISFENMSNDDAVKVLREAVMKPGPVKLVVAKCWDPNPKGYFTVSKQEPVRPLDPSAWVAHTQFHTNGHNQAPGSKPPMFTMNRSISSFGSNSSLSTSIADSTLFSYNGGGGGMHGPNAYGKMPIHNPGILATTATTLSESTRFGQLNLTTDTDMETVARTMAAPDSGLDIRDRNWLKITIPSAFIGSDVVDWLFNHVEGFPDRRDARKYACNLLKYGYIKHAVNKMRFSEQCYYVFGDRSMVGANGTTNNGSLFTLNEESEVDIDSVSEFDRDSNLYAPMSFPPPGATAIYAAHHYNQHHPGNGGGQAPKIYSNLNGVGIGGPVVAYLSSSSSNATSNSTSTTSNNTTSQTIATSSSAIVGPGMMPPGILNTDRSQACHMYYPPPNLQLTSFNNTVNTTCTSTNMSSSSMIFQNKPNAYETGKNDMAQTNNNNNNNNNYNDVTNTTSGTVNANQPPHNSFLSQSQYNSANVTNNNNQTNNYQNSNQPYYNSACINVMKMENRSIKSSDNSSSGSGNGSDVELLSSSKSKNANKKNEQRKQQQQYQQQQQQQQQQQVIYSQSNYYEINQYKISNSKLAIQSQSQNQSTQQQQHQSISGRTLDKVPKELRLSKQSFSAAMENPCEFFVDVM